MLPNMFLKNRSILVNPIRQQIAKLATSASPESIVTSTEPNKKPTHIIKDHSQETPNYVLSSLREFPSLKPITFQPVHSSLLNTPLRRDLLWKAVIYDADNARVGASNPPSRNQMGYSRRKLAAQKGSGNARVGSRGSPIREDGGYALARNAPNQHGTEVNYKVYQRAVRIALSDAYRKGKLFLINDSLELPTNDDLTIKMFLKKFQLHDKKLLFITNELRENLLEATKTFEKKIDVAQKEGIKVKDLLKAEQIFIELSALKAFQKTYGEEL
ncbi:50S ribosomal protein L4 [Wickerhamomyces ciferrii]|uniref:Large ribosomal subunit protein uL4m n=1 Tax=Wickerhamomyces ciferrii (strain ATCC 14091 / BCRC 22168 / CBS 111 / JCM 3599 / NBRC 0793 / NRRL Y-1031 F-60-10) TaxID=1206466 RepID=K0KXV6_WICCF|nr:50S ribosomal protein L4 [Wickerhamomyces ciferrii]CCH46897.1 50S ribosomal protein L4 [Wickerhamomyces ciferrii]